MVPRGHRFRKVASMSRQFPRLTAVMIALAMLLSACGASTDDTGGSDADKMLRFVTVYPANTTDPQLVHTAFILNSGTVETLVGLDPTTLELYPWLAESWQSDDAQHWEFTIRRGVSFHNGKPLDATAVEAALRHALDVNPGVVAALKIAEMRVIDDYTLNITTESVFPALISNLVHYNTVITDVTDPGDLPQGTGAFAFEKFDPAGESVLVRNTDYWDGQAKLDRVVMTANEDSNARMLALQAGDADIIYRPSLESIQTLDQDPDVTVESVVGTRVYHLQFNYVGTHEQLWNNAEFRRGIDALLNRESIVESIMAGQGTVAYNPFPGDWPFSPTPLDHPHGTEVALQHFKAAGLDVTDGMVTLDGQPLTMKIVGAARLHRRDRAEWAARAGLREHADRDHRGEMGRLHTAHAEPGHPGEDPRLPHDLHPGGQLHGPDPASAHGAAHRRTDAGAGHDGHRQGHPPGGLAVVHRHGRAATLS